MSAPIDSKSITEADIYRTAIRALKELIKRNAFDANMVELGFIRPFNISAYNTVRKAQTAVKFFEDQLAQSKKAKGK